MLRFLLSLLLAVVQLPAAAAAKPNVVVVLADDLGYGDVGCYNPDRGKIPTPHIDRLAADGLRFTDAHSASAVCSPTRYALLTGRYPWRTRLQQGIVSVWGAPLIAPDRLTVAGLAKRHGYHTACVGKWHLGWGWPIAADQKKHFQGLGGQAGGGGTVKTEDTPEQVAAWKAVFAKPIPAARPPAGSTRTSAPTCRTGRRTASSRTTGPSASRPRCNRPRTSRRTRPASRGRPCRGGSWTPCCRRSRTGPARSSRTGQRPRRHSCYTCR